MQEFKLQGAAQRCTNTKLCFGCEGYLVRVQSIQKWCREGFNWILYSKIFFILHLYIHSCCNVSTMGECSPQRNLYLCLWYAWGESKLFHSFGQFLVDCREIYSIHALGVTLYIVDHNYAKEISCRVIVVDTKREMGVG